MSDLADRYRKAVAFDEDATKAELQRMYERGEHIRSDEWGGRCRAIARWENARRAKIDEAVAELIRAADALDRELANPAPDYVMRKLRRENLRTSIAKLSEVLGE